MNCFIVNDKYKFDKDLPRRLTKHFEKNNIYVINPSTDTDLETDLEYPLLIIQDHELKTVDMDGTSVLFDNYIIKIINNRRTILRVD